MLFTSALVEEPLGDATPQFLDNEFTGHDVNRFVDLATPRDLAQSLDHATAGDRSSSPRYRQVLAPLGLGDELRVALASGGRCWGVLCLHREDTRTRLRLRGDRAAPGSRTAPRRRTPTGSGTTANLRRRAKHGRPRDHHRRRRTVAAFGQLPRPILAQRTGRQRMVSGLRVAAVALRAAATALNVDDDPRAEPPPSRLPRSRGGWIGVHASPLQGAEGPQVAVILDAADATQLSSLVLAARGLTHAQSRVAALVLQGRSTRSIVAELEISANTVQEHLRAVFDKFGIGSRRELVAELSGRHQ